MRPSPLSPVRRAIPVGNVPATASLEQRLHSISSLSKNHVSNLRKTSFLHSRSLKHSTDALRGAYMNYLNTMSDDVQGRFLPLLLASLNCLSATLELIHFSQIYELIEEVLLYCRTVVELAPTETTRVIMQFFKILFGSNVPFLSVVAKRELILQHDKPPKDLLDSCILRTANYFTLYIVNTGRDDYIAAALTRYAGWLRKELLSKAHAPSSSTISPFVSLFEPFVSLSINLYRSTSSTGTQSAVLQLLCVLIRGGINYSLLDSESRLLNFIINQINEIGARTSIPSDEDCQLLCSIFAYFTLLSHAESRGQVIMEPAKVEAVFEYVAKSCEARQNLLPYAFICLRYLIVDGESSTWSSNPFILKVMYNLGRIGMRYPTELIQLWTIYLYSVSNRGEKASWTKASVELLESFQELKTDNWNFMTTLNAMTFLRSCCSTVCRPVDALFRKIISLLEDLGTSCFRRLMLAIPYIFILLCVMKEDSYLARIEQICSGGTDQLGRLLMELLWQCFSELWYMLNTVSVDESDHEKLTCLYLLVLSHAARSGGSTALTKTFKNHFPLEQSKIVDIIIFYPRLYAQTLAFFSAAEIAEDFSFSSSFLRYVCDLYLSIRWRLSVLNVNALESALNMCSANVFLKILQNRLIPHMKSLDTSDKERLLQVVISRVLPSKTPSMLLNVLEVVSSCDLLQCSDAIEFITCVKHASALVDRVASSLDVYKDNKDQSSATGLVSSSQLMIKCESEVNELFDGCDVSGAISSLNYTDKYKPCNFSSETMNGYLSALVYALLDLAVSEKGFVMQPGLWCKVLCSLRTDLAINLLKKMYDYKRTYLLSSFMDVMDSFKVGATCCGGLYGEKTSIIVENLDALASAFVTLAFDRTLNCSLQLFVQTIISEHEESLIYDKASDWAIDGETLDHWVERYSECMSSNSALGRTEDYLRAVCFGITRRSFLNAIEQAQNAEKVVEQQLSLALSLDRLMQRSLPSSLHLRNDGKTEFPKHVLNLVIHNRTEKDFDTRFYSEAIQAAFEVTQRIQHVLHKKLVKTHLRPIFELLAKAVMRLPLLNDISCIPRSALLCGWRPEPEVGRSAITVPTVNIHYLGNVDILREFVWRILWAGWNRRSNFDNFSMSLFGVISSTPSGSELNNASMNAMEQIMASTLAVEGLTNLLLETLLYPERGNPVVSKFIVKSRYSTADFLSTGFGQRVCMLKAMLLESPCVEFSFKRNLEFLGDSGKRYRPGQFSVLTSWNMAGVIEEERNLYKGIIRQNEKAINEFAASRGISSSESNYLLISGHDSTYESCLRTLFDTYSHWFRSGIDTVPLSLLSATIKSMSLLSDLFTEMDQYRFVFGHMKTLFTIRSHLENVDIGNIIYTLLKCTAILGIEDLATQKSDAQKSVQMWIEVGLQADLSEVRIRTLQGSLFLLQALSFEHLKMVFTYIQTFVLLELEKRSADNREMGQETREYETMLWTVGFFFCNNPLHSSDSFRGTFFNYVYSSFIAPNTSLWLMDLLTQGIERLIIDSRVFVLSFNRIAIQILESYFSVPQKFVHAVRVFIACLYRGINESTEHRVGMQSYDPRVHLMEEYSTLFKVLAEGSEDDARRLTKVLPYILVDSLNQSELIDSILKELIHRYREKAHPRPASIFIIIHHWFVVLSSRETESVVLDWILNGLNSFQYVADAALFRFYVSAFLCATSTDPLISCLFYIVIGHSGKASWFDDFVFSFSVRLLFSKMPENSRHDLKDSMEMYVRDGKAFRDPRRIAHFPILKMQA